jgi:hypothetical protein
MLTTDTDAHSFYIGQDSRSVKRLYGCRGGALEQTDTKIRWGVEQRLEFIEFRLFWDGELNRSDITRRFGVSVPQASADLALYREQAPHNIRYDGSLKRYLAARDFKPIFSRPNADRYLVQLKAMADGVIDMQDTWIGYCPAAEAMPVPARRVDPAILKGLVGAIRTGDAIDILHRSMNERRPEKMWRAITPHAFAHDGLRWHVRAFCHIDRIFKDFVLSRCIAVGGLKPPEAKPQDDVDWNAYLEVVLEPNPALTERQRRTIAFDYDMPKGRAVVKVRRALLYYFNKRLRLDESRSRDDPAYAPIVVANQEEFMEAIPAIRSDTDLLT